MSLCFYYVAVIISHTQSPSVNHLIHQSHSNASTHAFSLSPSTIALSSKPPLFASPNL
ncbi:hypothetical protein GBA52_011139 [Prunus armeniaca]|nr:hypothetical protein GBA52_011139 [Prunus armeniaca]